MKKLIGGVHGFGSHARPAVASASVPGYLRLVDPCLTGPTLPPEPFPPAFDPPNVLNVGVFEPVPLALAGGGLLAVPRR